MAHERFSTGATDARATPASRQYGIRRRHERFRDGVGDQYRTNVPQCIRTSKCEAELLVANAHAKKALVARIYRPSIVIGNSITGRATHFHGVYAFIRGLFAGAERLRRKASSNGPVHLPVRVLGKTTTTLNFVPIDYVVNGMVHIGNLENSAGGTYHLANPYPTPNDLWLPNICRLLHVTGVQLVDQTAFNAIPATKMETWFQKQMAFYYMYLQESPDLTAAVRWTRCAEPGSNARALRWSSSRQ
jgi:nucleoside-diphosphate-sugar epimerase